MKKIHPLVDGLYYKKDKKELKAQVEFLLETYGGEPDPRARGIVAPHGAWEFAGPYLAAAYGAARGLSPETVLILAPVHREPVGPGENLMALPPGDIFETPLGEVPVDARRAEALLFFGGFSREEVPYLEEPAVECQLPFIQVLFPKAKILPIYYSETSAKTRRLLVRGLKTILGGPVFTVVTSNLSGYLPAETSRAQAEDFIAGVNAPEGFHPGKYLSGLSRRRPAGPKGSHAAGVCGLANLAAWWAAMENRGTPEIALRSWGPDTTLAGAALDDTAPAGAIPAEEKQIFYGGFVLRESESRLV